jgi:hypothetical protein
MSQLDGWRAAPRRLPHGATLRIVGGSSAPSFPRKELFALVAKIVLAGLLFVPCALAALGLALHIRQAFGAETSGALASWQLFLEPWRWGDAL